MKESNDLKRPKYPVKKDVLLVVDMPTKEEVAKGEPFFSSSNINLLTSLRTGRANVFNTIPVHGWNGIMLADMAMTYVDYSNHGNMERNYDYEIEISKKYVEGYIPFRDVYLSPRLNKEVKDFYNLIDMVQPKLILLTGKWGVYFMSEEVRLSDNRGGTSRIRKPLGSLSSYRGSILIKDNRIIFPFYHPRNCIAMPNQSSIIEMDIQKAGDIFSNIKKEGIDYYKVNHTYHIGDKSIDYIRSLLSRMDSGEKLTLNFDIETFFYRTPGASVIDCIGFADSRNEGGCVAFCTPTIPSLYTLEEEQEIMGVIFQIMTHDNVSLCGQNAVAFDTMVILGRWLFRPKIDNDTLIMQHILYDFLPKELAFLASMYCRSSSYWKGEIGGDTRWVYNVKDCIYTYEVMEELHKQFIGEDRLVDLYRFTMDELVPATIRTMTQGVRLDLHRKEELKGYFNELAKQVESSLCDAIGMDFNLKSGKQKQKILEFLGVVFVYKKVKGKEDKITLDGDAMIGYIESYPLLRPFISLLLEYTAINKFSSTFLSALPDEDNRMRTQYKVAGTNTGRLASSKNAFGRALNLNMRACS